MTAWGGPNTESRSWNSEASWLPEVDVEMKGDKEQRTDQAHAQAKQMELLQMINRGMTRCAELPFGDW